MKPYWIPPKGEGMAAFPVRKWWKEIEKLPKDVHWKTLEHHGPLFPPEYIPHGIPIKVNGKKVRLTPEQEEVATWYARLIESEHVKKEIFRVNFWNDWSQYLRKTPEGKQIKSLEEVDFQDIYDHLKKVQEEKRKRSKEEKDAEKAKKEREQTLIYGVCLLDGQPEKVEGYAIEPPGIFLGRGNHPKAGKIKARVTPEEITINCSDGAVVPVPPKDASGKPRSWAAVIHNPSVSWLFSWKSPVTGDPKYAWFSKESKIRGSSDLNKFEKARKLGVYILDIRRRYRRDFNSKDPKLAQTAVIVYLIDFLAVRAGTEKTEDEADTVGCSTLRVEHVITNEDGKLTLDFLGKDSMRYFKVVEIDPTVWLLLESFKEGKSASDLVFDKTDEPTVNEYLKMTMPGLTAKVFRTYNASLTLQRELDVSYGHEFTTKEAKLAFYNQANTTVALLCNHQKTVSKNFGKQMEKLDYRITEIKTKMKVLQVHLDYLAGEVNRPPAPRYKLIDPETGEEVIKTVNLPLTEEKTKKAIETLRDRLERIDIKRGEKDKTKAVALGTSKINYLDPRISIAWCKRVDLDYKAIFSTALIKKFSWAMDVDESWSFGE